MAFGDEHRVLAVVQLHDVIEKRCFAAAPDAGHHIDLPHAHRVEQFGAQSTRKAEKGCDVPVPEFPGIQCLKQDLALHGIT